MSSRFVPAGADPVPASSNDDWDRARQRVEEQRGVRPVESGKQEDGKSLYEVLQANKAAKQEAFEEATKVRNQFRSLDDSEVEFLDSIRENERAKEFSVRQETAEQLEIFRRQRAVVEQGPTELDDTTLTSKPPPSRNAWTTLKKRRRDKDEEDQTVPKLRKSSSSTPSNDQDPVNAINNKKGPVSRSLPRKDVHSTTNQKEKPETKELKSGGLGLVAYSSDDDD